MKIISIIILTASAVISLLFNFKNIDGTITEWGIVTIIIVLISGIIAILLEILENKEKNRQKKISEFAEKRRIESLEIIQLGINNSRNPLVPFRALFTLKKTYDINFVKKIANHSSSIKHQIKTEYLKLVGTVKMGEVPFNIEEEAPIDLNYSINDIEYLNHLIETKIIIIPSIQIEIIPENINESITFEYPSSAFNSLENSIKELRIYDNKIYQDFIAPKWKMNAPIGEIFGVKHLLRAKIKVKAVFYNNSETLPEFTNILLYFSDNPNYILSFTKEQLIESQSSYIQKEEGGIKFGNDLAKKMFQKHIRIFEITITDEIFNNQIRILA